MSLETVDLGRIRLRDGERLLDLGCGEGRHAISAYMARRLEVVGIDLSVRDLRTTQDRFRQFARPDDQAGSLVLSIAGGERLPFADASFDKVICSEVLEHIPDYRSVIREVSRVLKIGGVAAFSVPSCFPEWVCWRLSDAYHEVEGGHLRIFRAKALQQDIEAAGFICYDRRRAHALHVPYWWLKCLLWREEGQEQPWLLRQYHRLLVWDLMQQPLITTWLERLLNPLLGKSLVMYFVREAEAP